MRKQNRGGLHALFALVLTMACIAGTCIAASAAPAAPFISSIAPRSGSVGDAVTISGTGFSSATQVFFSSDDAELPVAAAFSVLSDTEIEATVPRGAVTGPYGVATAGGTTTSGDVFTVIQTARRLSPTTVSGTVYNALAQLGLSGITVRAVRAGSTDTTVVAEVVSDAKGHYALALEPGSYTLSAVRATDPLFRIAATFPQPVVIPAASGTSLATLHFRSIGITGRVVSPSNVPVAGVRFNLYNPKDTGRTRILRAGTSDANGFFGLEGVAAGTWNIVPVSPTNFTYTPTSRMVPIADKAVFTVFTALDPNPAPKITSIAPTSGKVGDKVTITGNNFTGTTQVTFTGATATAPVASPFTVVSATSVTTTVPTGAVTGALSLKTPNGTALSPAFTLVTPTPTPVPTPPAPTITSVAPTSGRVGDTVTLSGTNFSGATQVTFTGATAAAPVTATFTVVSATSATATVPTGALTGPITLKTPGGTALSPSFEVFDGPVTGIYRLTTRGQQGMALDVSGFRNSNSAVVQIWGAAATVNQQWLVERQNDGSYKIKAFAGSNSNQVLDCANGQTTNGNTVATYADNGNSAQLWYFKPVGGGFYRIIPKNGGIASNRTLDVRNGTAAKAGDTLNIWDYLGGDNQVFRLDNPGPRQPTTGIYSLSTRGHPELALDVNGFANANSTNVLLWNSTHASNQQWKIETTGGNLYKIYAYSGANSLQMLDLANGNVANGTSVTTYEDNGGAAQLWYFKDIGNGFFRIIPKNAGPDSLQTLDVRNGNNAKAGDSLNVYQYLGGDNQVFKLDAPGALKVLPSWKKGMGGRPAQVAAEHAAWFYTWGGDRPGDAPPTDVSEFVPMMWGYYGGDATGYVDFMKSQAGAKTILAFNEPDHTDQSNLSVAAALDGYQYLAKGGVPIGSPACADPMSQWMSDFMQGAKDRGYRVDYITVHCYIRDPWQFLNQIEQIHNRYWDKQMWITEFAPADWSGTNPVSVEEAANFMKIVVPELNKRWYVDRYAWYTGSSPGPWTLGSAALVNTDGSLTDLGKLYSRM